MLIIYFSVILWGMASTSLYTITLAYLGERIKISELSIATSVFIIIYEAGEFVRTNYIGLIMEYLWKYWIYLFIINLYIFFIHFWNYKIIFKKICTLNYKSEKKSHISK